MPEDLSGAGVSTDPRLPSSSLHPRVDANTSIDACPFAAMIKGMNVDPNLVFAVLTQFFGSSDDEGNDELDAEGGVPAPSAPTAQHAS